MPWDTQSLSIALMGRYLVEAPDLRDDRPGQSSEHCDRRINAGVW